MKYLSFDIECCDGQHICEFGYVIIDEKFNVLERDCITINPEYKFKLTGREKESDISLAFPEDVYYNSPTFDVYYERIKRILTTPDCQIIGFSLSNGAAIRLSADGKYLYVSLREENGICVYQVNGKNLTLLQQTNCGGDSPRDFDICGDYLIVCNENSENVVVYRIANRLIINKVAEISIKRALCVVK